MPDLILESLSVNRCTYGSEEGKYTGSLAFRGHYGQISITLDPIISEKVLALCADALVENARQVADNLTATIINQSGKQLPSPEKGEIVAIGDLGVQRASLDDDKVPF